MIYFTCSDFPKPSARGQASTEDHTSVRGRKWCLESALINWSSYDEGSFHECFGAQTWYVEDFQHCFLLLGICGVPAGPNWLQHPRVSARPPASFFSDQGWRLTRSLGYTTFSARCPEPVLAAPSRPTIFQASSEKLIIMSRLKLIAKLLWMRQRCVRDIAGGTANRDNVSVPLLMLHVSQRGREVSIYSVRMQKSTFPVWLYSEARHLRQFLGILPHSWV